MYSCSDRSFHPLLRLNFLLTFAQGWPLSTSLWLGAPFRRSAWTRCSRLSDLMSTPRGLTYSSYKVCRNKWYTGIRNRDLLFIQWLPYNDCLKTVFILHVFTFLFLGEFLLRLRHLEQSLLQALNEVKGRILDDDRWILYTIVIMVLFQARFCWGVQFIAP